jgi:hypothetical protein
MRTRETITQLEPPRSAQTVQLTQGQKLASSLVRHCFGLTSNAVTSNESNKIKSEQDLELVASRKA